MTGDLGWGNGRFVRMGGSETALDVVAGRVAIRLEPANIANGLQSCAMLRDTGTGALFPIATATPPTEYDLPLEAGVESAMNKAVYWKTQEGIVTVVCTVRKANLQPFTKDERIATLPVGFRPSGRLCVSGAVDATNYGSTLGTAEFEILANGDINLYGFSVEPKWCICHISFPAT